MPTIIPNRCKVYLTTKKNYYLLLLLLHWDSQGITLNLPFSQGRSLLAHREKTESSSTLCRPKLSVTAWTIFSNDFPHRKFFHLPQNEAIHVATGTKEGLEEALGPGLLASPTLPARKMI